MTNPLVSVIVPVRNGEQFLEQALDSVAAQEYKPYEVIVVDGASTDKTEDIARSFSGVQYRRQSGSGIADAYNTGVDAARGELVAFLSSDDWWTPDKLEVQVEYFSEHQEFDLTLTHFEYFLDEGTPRPENFREDLLGRELEGWLMETLMARRNLFRRIGRFDRRLATAEDVDWLARAKDAGVGMAVIPRVLLYKRVHGSNLSLNMPSNDANLLHAVRQSVERKQRKTTERETPKPR